VIGMANGTWLPFTPGIPKGDMRMGRGLDFWFDSFDNTITSIYRRFVLEESAVEYPMSEEKERPLPKVAEEPTNFDLG